MRRVPGLLLLVALLPTVPLPAQSGNLQPLPADARQGFWIGAGLGAGEGGLHCGICDGRSDRGTAGYLRAGFTLNRRMLLGAETSGWQRTGEEGRRRILALTGGAWWYPSERHGHFVRFGAGLSRWRASEDDEAVVSNALALVAGVGYEVRVNPGLSAAVYLNVLGSSSGSLWLERKDDDSFERRRLPAGGHAFLLQLGIGITRH